MIRANGVPVVQEQFGDGTLKCSVADVPVQDNKLTILWCYDNDAELFTLWCVVQDLKQSYPHVRIHLTMPYIPHARQDRNVSGKLFTLKYFSKIINLLDFDTVEVFDPHSDVSTALIDRVVVFNFNIDSIIKNLISTDTKFQMMYPDTGAAKKYNAGDSDVIGYKHRNYEGRIDAYSFTGLNPDTDTVIIRDDVCSFGGTYVAAAKELRKRGIKNIYLIVSHCENNILKGEVFNYIDKVITTDSICTVKHPKLHTHSFWRS